MQGKSLFILILFASLSLSSAFAQSNNEAKKLFNEGNALLKSGDFEGAIGKYNAAIKIEKHEFFFYQRGLAEKKARKVDESIASFEEAIKLNPKFAAGYVALAGSQFGKGDYQAAIDKQGITGADGKPRGPLIKGPKGAAYFEMGLAYRNMGNMAKAKDAFSNAKKDPAYARNADYELKMLK